MPTEQVHLLRGADLRYVGEGYEVSVVVDDVTGADALRAVEKAFHVEHNRVYGFSYEGEQQVEVVALRVQALGELHRPTLATAQPSGGASKPTGSRSVYWRSTGWIDCPTYDRATLGDGDTVTGPAIVEEYGSTYVVPTGWNASVDHFGNILSEREDA